MAIEVKVPKNTSRIKTKVALNLTKRQLICFGAAAFVGIPFYLLAKRTLGTDISVILMMLLIIPLFLLAMYERNGMTAEQILKLMIRQKYIMPGIRRYRSENLYRRLEEREKLKKEVMRLEAKADKRRRENGEKAGECRKEKSRPRLFSF